MIDLNAQGCHSVDQPDGWAQDVKTVTTTVLTTTGGTLWSAAERCRQFLEAMAAELELNKPGIRVSCRHSCTASNGCCQTICLLFTRMHAVLVTNLPLVQHHRRGLRCCQSCQERLLPAAAAAQVQHCSVLLLSEKRFTGTCMVWLSINNTVCAWIAAGA